MEAKLFLSIPDSVVSQWFELRQDTFSLYFPALEHKLFAQHKLYAHFGLYISCRMNHAFTRFLTGEFFSMRYHL